MGYMNPKRRSQRNERQELADALRRVRTERGISRNALVRRTGMRYDLVQAIEGGIEGYTIPKLFFYLEGIDADLAIIPYDCTLLTFLRERGRHNGTFVQQFAYDVSHDLDFCMLRNEEARIAFMKYAALQTDCYCPACVQLLEEYEEYKADAERRRKLAESNPIILGRDKEVVRNEEFYLEMTHGIDGYYTEDEEERPLETLDEALAYYAELQEAQHIHNPYDDMPQEWLDLPDEEIDDEELGIKYPDGENEY